MKTDAQIQKDVMAQLNWEPFLETAEVGVAVKNGVVTLSGTVGSFAKKISAERAAKKVAGVKAVAEEIEVKFLNSDKKNDTEIAEAALNALKWHTALREDKIKIKVEKGWLTLEGEVEWEFQKNSALHMVENLKGVKGVINKITIEPKMKPNEVENKIREAFHRSATIDSERIHVETAGKKVTLTGKVRSWPEKRDAERAAWYAPGINEVDNRIEVESEVLTY